MRASGADPRYLFAPVGVADSTRRIGSVARRRGSEAEANQAFREAELEYRKIVEAHPNLSAAHLGLGDLYIETGARKEAIASYSRALVLRPDQPAPHLRLGMAIADQDPRAAAQQAKVYMAIEQRDLKQGQRISIATKIATGNPPRVISDKPIEVKPSTAINVVPKVEGLPQAEAAKRIAGFGLVRSNGRKAASRRARCWIRNRKAERKLLEGRRSISRSRSRKGARSKCRMSWATPGNEP